MVTTTSHAKSQRRALKGGLKGKNSLHKVPEPEPPLPADDSGADFHIKVSLPLTKPSVAKFLEKDKNTPDSHVKRDERMVRLTGVHPFNAEAPLTALYDDGFLTSMDLFYVRNHGPVPQVFDDEVWSWEFSIEGLVENPFTITLRELVAEFDQITLPITLVCAGNRRKEQNVVRKSKGFSWGSAGLSTALFTGTLMANVLQKAKPKRGAKYVCMEGADVLPNGNYGTSVKLNWAMDPNKGFMLSHLMNGKPLEPDHGRPVRVVIPGQIGGRSVKWLKRLIVTAEPSDNWYHYYDNKLLPTSITPEQSADLPHVWKDERYSIYDLNLNSVVAYPQHDEELGNLGDSSPYDVRGYAYSGAGRRVTRVEVSFDSGKSWKLSNVDYPEDRYRDVDLNLYGGRVDMNFRETCFCWCFWSYKTTVGELKGADSIIVRGMDDSIMSQPRDMYWSVLGMMNNPWFRVAINRDNGKVKFEHPTSLDPNTSGWMEKVSAAGGDLLNGHWGETPEGSVSVTAPAKVEIDMKNPSVKRVFTYEEFVSESSDENPLFVIEGEVYNGKDYLESHPGGELSITAVNATDCTEEFLAIHSENAKNMMRDYHVGSLDEAGREALDASADAAEPLPATREIFLHNKHWTQARLTEKKIISWDTKIFVFDLDHEAQVLGLPTGHHLMLRIKDVDSGESIIRAYTPLSDNSLKGKLEILIKLYLPTETSAGGKMTTALDKIPLGSLLDFKGPVGKLEYLGQGGVNLSGSILNVPKFVMICGGSGITPIFQIFRSIMESETDTTQCTILYGNRQEEDILCKSELDSLSKDKQNCRVIHTLTQPSPSWSGLTGRISNKLLEEEAAHTAGALALICGPPAMEKSVKEALLAMGWGEDSLVFF